MIIDILIFVIVGFLNFVFNLLPTGSLPSEVSSSVGSMFAVAHSFDGFFPVTVVIQVMGLILTVEGILLLFRLGRYILHYIRGVPNT